MELQTSSGMYLITKEEKERYDKLEELAKIIRSKYFSLGRHIDKFCKLSERK